MQQLLESLSLAAWLALMQACCISSRVQTAATIWVAETLLTNTTFAELEEELGKLGFPRTRYA